MSSERDDLHRLIDEMSEAELVDFASALRARRGHEPDGDGAAAAGAWEAAAAQALGDRLAELEADGDPAARAEWLQAFAEGARPCRYVPGQGFVPS